MLNALFIDYRTFLDIDGKLSMPSVFALKDIALNASNIMIVCTNNEDERNSFNYDLVLTALSQALNLKKSLFFDVLDDDNSSLSMKISKWMHRREVVSFAVVVQGKDDGIGLAYPNNTLFCGPNSFSEAHSKDVLWMMSKLKSRKESEHSVWVISDTHFGHRNIIKYCNRPWNHGKDEDGSIVVTDEDVLAMDNEIIKRWNSVVKDGDIVWHLGDFALGGKEVAERVFPQLNGKINLVMGNHDHWKLKWYYDLGFNRVYDKKVIINDFVILSHAPLMFLNENCPFFNVFGHVHSSPMYPTWSKTGCCVCVERHDYTPVSFEELKKKYNEMNKED